jgi:hypothetical protein
MTTTFLKRQKEMKRQEKQREKAERRKQKKLAKLTADVDAVENANSGNEHPASADLHATFDPNSET